MEQKYRVADHVFSLVMRDESPMWGKLGNYSPFMTDEGDAIFSLEVVKDLTPGPRKPLLVGKETEPEMPLVDLYGEADGGMWVEIAPLSTMTPTGFIRISSDRTRGKIRIEGAPKFCIDNALMLMYAFRTVSLGTLEMHSSVIVHGGNACMFLGHSGAGKSTHSRMWIENIPDSRLLNDDNPILRILDDGEVRVYGSPWSGKTPCYRNESAPVRATVHIVQAPHNSIRKLRTMEAFSILHSSISGYWGDEEMVDCLCNTISSFISKVGHYELECLPDAEAARLTESTTRG